MADVFLPKDIKMAIIPGTTLPTNFNTGALHGIGDGLVAVTWADPADVRDKAGATSYRERYDTGLRNPTCSVNCQLGSVVWGLLVGKHGAIQSALLDLPGNSSVKPRKQFQCFIVEPEFEFNTTNGDVTGVFQLMINGAPTEGSYT